MYPDSELTSCYVWPSIVFSSAVLAHMVSDQLRAMLGQTNINSTQKLSCSLQFTRDTNAAQVGEEFSSSQHATKLAFNYSIYC